MFRVRLDTRPLLKELTTQQRQHPYALALALNRTAEERQRGLQDHITTRLTIRQANARNQFRRAVRFAREDRADKRQARMVATVRIIGGDAKATTDLFRRLGTMILRQDDGGTSSSSALYRTQRNQFTPGGFIIPAPGLRTETKAMPRKLYPSAIGLTPQTRIAGGDEFLKQYKGGRGKRGGFKKGTTFYFVKEDVGIFRREQVGKESEYDAIWFFRPKIRLPRRLRLAETFQDGLALQLQANYAGFFDMAMRTAR